MRASVPTRRDKIVATAESLFTRFGFKAVTMEMVASETHVAKGTVYANFANKDALFLAVAEHLAARLTDAVQTALACDGAVADRVSGALAAKHEIVFHLVRSSPHAAELFAASGVLAGELFAKTDADIVDMLAYTLAAGGRALDEAADLARLAFAAAAGLAEQAPTVDQMKRDIGFLVAKLTA